MTFDEQSPPPLVVLRNMHTNLKKRNQGLKKWLSIVLFLSIFSSLSAQLGSIKGRVYDKKTNEPLAFATVLIEGTQIGASTDESGIFVIENVLPSFCVLEVRYVGYDNTFSPEIQVQGNQTTYIDIPVRAANRLLNEVVVRTRLNTKKIESPLSVLEVGVQQIEKTAGVNRDISKLAQTLPGVGVTDPQRNDLIVRGGGPAENVFYLDGVEIPIINHFTTQGSTGGAVGIINPDFVRNLSLYTGAFPASKPNALSSVMDIKLRDGDKERLRTKIAVGASDAGLTLEGPVGKRSTFIVSARQSYLQFLFQALGLPFLPTYNDFQLKYKLELNPKNHLTVIGLGAIDDMKLNLSLKKPTESQAYLLGYLPTYKQWNYTIGIVYKHFSDRHYNTLVASRNMLRNRNFKHIDNDPNKDKSMDYRSDEIENKLRFEQAIPDGFFNIRWGAGLKYATYTNQTYRQIFAQTGATSLTYDTKLSLVFYHAFGQFSKDFWDERLQLSLGVNLVGNSYNQSMANPLHQISPRLSATYALSDRWNLNANIGRYAAPPSYTTLGYRDGSGNLVNQHEQLKYIISNQLVAGVEMLPFDKAKFTVEGFYKQYENYPFSVADGLSIASKGADFGQIGDEEIQSIGKGRAYGVEFLLKVAEMNGLNITATYTLFKSEFTDKNNTYRPTSWDTGSLLNLIASYKFLKSWNVGTRWRWIGGKPYSPIDTQLSAQRMAWDIMHQPYLDYTQFNSLRLAPSHQLDMRIDKEFYFKKWLLNLYLDVQNLYNFQSESIPIYTNLDPDGTPQIDPNDPTKYRLRPIELKVGNVLPTVGIILKF